MAKKLSYEERCKIHMWDELPYMSARAIGKELGRSHKAVLKELNKALPARISASAKARLSDEQAHDRRVEASKKMRLKSEEIRHYTELHLREAGWSPETIAGRLTKLGYPISAEAIYLWINEEKCELKQYLLIAGKSKRRRCVKKKHRQLKKAAAPKVSIEKLPIEAKTRSEIGHIELDAMHGKRGGTVIQNKVDRKSRKLWLDKADSLESAYYAEILVNRVKKDIPAIKTILNDNGSEHAEHVWVDAAIGTQTYFCHPYCASERGTVENRNKILRFYLPKGCDLEDLPEEYLEHIEDQINNKPMKVLGFATPNEIWFDELEKLKKAA